MLSAAKTCGHMKVERPIKWENLDGDKSRFSMASHCSGCEAIFDKPVTLLTDYDSYDYMSEGFRFGPNTIIVEGLSPVKDCSNISNAMKRSVDDRPTTEAQAPQEIVTTTENPISSPPTTSAVEVSTEVTETVNKKEDVEPDKKTAEEGKDRRTVEPIQGDNFNLYGRSYLTYGSTEGNTERRRATGYGQPGYGVQQQPQYRPQSNVSSL